MITNPLAENQFVGVKGGASVMALIPGGLLVNLGPSNVVYVDPVYGTAAGNRGNLARPFATVAQGLAAMLTGDQVRLSPGTHAAPASLTQPATVTSYSIVGAGGSQQSGIADAPTRILGDANIDVFVPGAALGLTHCYVSDLLIEATGTGKGIVADGSLYAANAFMADGLHLNNVSVKTAGGARALEYKYLRSSDFCHVATTSPVSITSCGRMIFDLCPAMGGAAITVEYNGTDALRTTTQTQLILRGGTVVGNVTMVGAAKLVGDASVTINDLTANVLSVFAGAYFPGAQYRGRWNSLDFQTAAAKMLPDTATAMAWDFGGSQSLTLAATSARFEVTAPATAQTVNLCGASSVGTGITLNAGAGVNLKARGCGWRTQPTLTTGGTGTIDPGQIVLAAVALAGANQAVALGFTSPVTTYVPEVSLDTLATGAHAENTFTTVGFNLQTAAGGGLARVTITWP